MKLIVADDSTTIQKVIKLAFKGEAAELVTVSSFVELLGEVGKTTFDAVICDANLSGMHGVQGLEKLSSAIGQTPLLLLKGSFDSVDETSLNQSGYHNFLKKPFDAPTIVQKVRALVLGSRVPKREDGSEANPEAGSEGNEAPTIIFGLPEETSSENSGSLDESGSIDFSAMSAPQSTLSSPEKAQDKQPAVSTGEKGKKTFSTHAGINELSLDLDSAPSPLHVERPSQPPQPAKANFDTNDLAKLGSLVAPFVMERVKTELPSFLKEHLSDRIETVLRDVIKEELRRLTDEKNSLYIDS